MVIKKLGYIYAFVRGVISSEVYSHEWPDKHSHKYCGLFVYGSAAAIYYGSSSSSFIDTKIKYIGKYIVTMCPANIISAVT